MELKGVFCLFVFMQLKASCMQLILVKRKLIEAKFYVTFYFYYHQILVAILAVSGVVAIGIVSAGVAIVLRKRRRSVTLKESRCTYESSTSAV